MLLRCSGVFKAALGAVHAALFGLKVLPVFQDLRSGVGFVLAKNVGMPANHLGVDALNDVADIESAGARGKLGMKYDLEQQVAHLLGKFVGVTRLQRIENFVGFLNEIGAESFVGLFAVPGATVGSEETLLERDKLLEKSAGPGARAFACDSCCANCSLRFASSFPWNRHNVFSTDQMDTRI